MTIRETLELEALMSTPANEKTDPGQNAQGMTIKEIAELCGVDRHTVERWAHKLTDGEGFLNHKMLLRNSIRDRLNQGSPEIPSTFTLDETLAIIGEGGGNKTLASLLADSVDPRLIVRKAVQLVKGATKRYSKYMEPVHKAASDVRWLQDKYEYDEKVPKQDTLRLFRCAVILSNYYEDMHHLDDMIVLENSIVEEKIAIVMKRLEDVTKLQAEGGNVPTVQSKEWWIDTLDYFHTGKKLEAALKALDEMEDKTGLTDTVIADNLIKSRKRRELGITYTPGAAVEDTREQN
jgi:transcriptional regulator with XRE-family HTH domain